MATKSQVVSWMGVSLSLVQGLLKEVQKLGGGDEEVRRLVTPEGESLLAKFAEMIVGIVRPAYRVMVDYAKTLAEMISAGKYDWVNPDITREHFSISGNGKVEKELVLFHFSRCISSDDAIAEMARAGCKAGDIADLLVLGAEQPELQRQFPIVALGSVWQDSHGFRDVPSLGRYDAERHLHLDYFEHVWRERYRFLGCRK